MYEIKQVINTEKKHSNCFGKLLYVDNIQNHVYRNIYIKDPLRYSLVKLCLYHNPWMTIQKQWIKNIQTLGVHKNN